MSQAPSNIQKPKHQQKCKQKDSWDCGDAGARTSPSCLMSHLSSFFHVGHLFYWLGITGYRIRVTPLTSVGLNLLNSFLIPFQSAWYLSEHRRVRAADWQLFGARTCQTLKKILCPEPLLFYISNNNNTQHHRCDSLDRGSNAGVLGMFQDFPPPYVFQSFQLGSVLFFASGPRSLCCSAAHGSCFGFILLAF